MTIITPELLQGLQTSIQTGITAILPVGLSVMGAMVGIRLLPKLIYRFI